MPRVAYTVAVAGLLGLLGRPEIAVPYFLVWAAIWHVPLPRPKR